ncbi:MAG: hypothetical protein ACFB4I_23245 [Cyanophyceae cyanobacterium]
MFEHIDWLSYTNLVELQTCVPAQTPPPLPAPAPNPPPAEDVELLKSQLEFLEQSHRQIMETMKQFLDLMRNIFIVLGFTLGIGGSLAAFFIGKSFKDFQEFSAKEVQNTTQSFKDFQEFARRDINDFRDFYRREVQEAIQRVRQEAEAQIPNLVKTEVGDLIRTEIKNVERTLRREEVIGSTLVDYYLHNGTSEPTEFKLLQTRNFKSIRFCKNIDDLSTSQLSRRSPSDVVILDLINYTTDSGQAFASLQDLEERDTAARPLIDELLSRLPESTVLIVYVNVPPPLRYLNSIPKNRYVVPANSPITLVGNAADGAYVARGDRRSRRA